MLTGYGSFRNRAILIPERFFMKRIASAILLAGLLTAGLSACGDDSPDKETTTPLTPYQEQVEDAEDVVKEVEKHNQTGNGDVLVIEVDPSK